MEIYLPIFGNISLEKTNWEYTHEARLWSYHFAGNPIDLDVHFKQVSDAFIEKVAQVLKNLPNIHQIGLAALKQDFQEGEILQDYIEEWKEDIFFQIFEEHEFENFISQTDPSKSIEERLLSLIRLVRIGIYAESPTSFITIDFAFGYESEPGFRDDMLVVTLDQQLAVTDICAEG